MRQPIFHLAALSDYIKLPNRGIQFPNPQPAQKNLFLAVLRASKIKVIISMFFISVLALHAEDWTVCGKTYQNVIVLKIEPDLVSIAYSGGMGRIALCDLNPDLQNKFGYSPDASKIAAKAREKQSQQADAQIKQEIADQPRPSTDAPTYIAPSNSPDNSSIQNQINSLESDIAFMKKEEAKLIKDGKKLASNGSIVSRGAYADKIVEEQSQIDALKSRLH